MIGTSSTTNGLGLGSDLSREFLVERRGALAAAAGLAVGFLAGTTVLARLALRVVFVSATSFERRFVPPPFFASTAAGLSLLSTDDRIREEDLRAGLDSGFASFDLTVVLPLRVLTPSAWFVSAAAAVVRVVLVRFTVGSLSPFLPSLLEASPCFGSRVN